VNPREAGFFSFLLALIRESIKVYAGLLKIMVPVIILVKIITELGLLPYLAALLEPVMQLMGLPGSMGLVWAAAILNNIYTGMIVFVSLPESFELTVAQVTILCTAMLMAHALPIELRIAQKCGTRLIFQGLFRVLCAIILGIILSYFYEWGGWLQGQNTVLWRPDPQPENLGGWVVAQARNLGIIYLIILGLISIIKFLDYIQVTRFLIWLLSPLFRIMGIGKQATSITIVGLTMGLAYGGALIIREVRTSRIPKRDVFFSLTLMGVAHSLIEDTLLMVLLGADLTGILLARLVFSIFLVFLLFKLWTYLPQKYIHRFLHPTDPKS